MFYRKELEIAILTSGAKFALQRSMTKVRDRLQILGTSFGAGIPCFGLYLPGPFLRLQL